MLCVAPQDEVRQPRAIFQRGTKRGRKPLIPLERAGKMAATPGATGSTGWAPYSAATAVTGT
jgi:hypothetical protein